MTGTSGTSWGFWKLPWRRHQSCRKTVSTEHTIINSRMQGVCSVWFSKLQFSCENKCTDQSWGWLENTSQIDWNWSLDVSACNLWLISPANDNGTSTIVQIQVQTGGERSHEKRWRTNGGMNLPSYSGHVQWHCVRSAKSCTVEDEDPHNACNSLLDVEQW